MSLQKGLVSCNNKLRSIISEEETAKKRTYQSKDKMKKKMDKSKSLKIQSTKTNRARDNPKTAKYHKSTYIIKQLH